MSETITKPFTKAEMAAMRGAEGGGGPKDRTRAEDTVRRGFWAKIKGVGRKLPFAEDLVAAYFCTLDPATPGRVRWVLIGALAYFVIPVDGIADFLPLLGFTDDAAVIAAALAQVAGNITPEHREKARQALQDEDEDGVTA